MLSYVGYHHEILPLLQIISHRTRAYIINAEGLPGFLVQIDFMQILRQADARGCLEIAKKWQELNLDKVSQELDVLESLFQKMTHLKENYPSLAKIVLLRQLGSSTKVFEY